MNYTKQIIEDAIKGGWSIQRSYYTRHIDFLKLKSANSSWVVVELDATTWIEDPETGEDKEVNMTSSHQMSSCLLDPTFWQAVGKTRGLGDIHNEHCSAIDYHEFTDAVECDCCAKTEWKNLWRKFIDHLADGNTYEEALSKLS